MQKSTEMIEIYNLEGNPHDADNMEARIVTERAFTSTNEHHGVVMHRIRNTAGREEVQECSRAF
jgi:hypothetical protein